MINLENLVNKTKSLHCELCKTAVSLADVIYPQIWELMDRMLKY